MVEANRPTAFIASVIRLLYLRIHVQSGLKFLATTLTARIFKMSERIHTIISKLQRRFVLNTSTPRLRFMLNA